LVGQTLDRNKLPLEAQILIGVDQNLCLNQFKVIGTIGSPSFTHWGGLNDLCYDPRDSTHNTLFVCSTIYNFIYKVTALNTAPVAVRYAGQDSGTGVGDGGGNVNGAATSTAQFNQPFNIIVADGTNVNAAAGTMFIIDRGNKSLRTVDPTGTTVSTL